MIRSFQLCSWRLIRRNLSRNFTVAAEQVSGRSDPPLDQGKQPTPTLAETVADLLAQDRTAAAADVIVGFKPDQPSSNAVLQQCQNDFLVHLAKSTTVINDNDISLALKTVVSPATGANETSAVNKFACTRLLLLCINNGKPERALEAWTDVLELFASRAPRSLSKLLDRDSYEPICLAAWSAYFLACRSVDSVDPETAFRLVPRSKALSSVPSSTASLRYFGGLVDSVHRGLVEQALAKLRRFVTSDWKSPDFIAHIRSTSFAGVRELYDEVKASSASIPEEVYSTFIRRLAETRQTERAFGVWNELLASYSHPQASSWGALLRAASLLPKNAREVFEVLWKRMEDSGVEPDTACYEARMAWLTRSRAHGQGKRESVAQAVTEFNQLRQTRPEIIDTYIVNNVLNGLADTRQFDAVDEILTWVKQSTEIKLTSYTFNTIIKAAAASRSGDESKGALAQKYVQQMLAAGIEPDIVTYQHAVDQMLRRGLPVDSLLAEMQDRNIRPNQAFLSSVAYGVGRLSHNVSVARKVWQALMRAKVPLNAETIGAFIELESRFGDLDVAMGRYLDEMRRQGLPPSVPTYNQIIRAAMRRNRIDIAERLFERLTNKSSVRLAPNVFSFMFLLTPSAAIRDSAEYQRLVRTRVGPELAKRAGSVMDFALAKAVMALPEPIVSSHLRALAHDLVVRDYDPKKAGQ